MIVRMDHVGKPKLPIMMPCEGSSQRGHIICGVVGRSVWAMCAMCGHNMPADDDGVVIQHTRADILAMLDRGDFDQ